jgi:hypothetical protein
MNATYDLMPVEEINKRKPRPLCEWDKLEKDIKKGKKNEYNGKGNRKS